MRPAAIVPTECRAELCKNGNAQNALATSKAEQQQHWLFCCQRVQPAAAAAAPAAVHKYMYIPYSEVPLVRTGILSFLCVGRLFMCACILSDPRV
jgi:hypothetical protein